MPDRLCACGCTEPLPMGSSKARKYKPGHRQKHHNACRREQSRTFWGGYRFVIRRRPELRHT